MAKTATAQPKARTLADVESDLAAINRQIDEAQAELRQSQGDKAQALSDLADDNLDNDLAARQALSRVDVLIQAVPIRIKRLTIRAAELVVEHKEIRIAHGYAAHAENMRLEDEARIEAEQAYARWKELDAVHTHYSDAVAGWHNEYQRLSRELSEAQATVQAAHNA
jgi:hypothetical protein